MAEKIAALLVLLLVIMVGPVAASPLDQAMDRVFTVRSADDEDRFLGSAFLWTDGTVAVTNAHVVGDAEEVRLIDRNGVIEVGLVIGRDHVRDVAVISVAPGRDGLALATTTPELGDEVFALGAPLGIEFTLTEGRISAKARQVDVTVPLRLVQHDAAVNPGSSGGPLVDIDGRLLGMNSQIADGSRMFVGIAYAISTADLDRIVTGLIAETLPALPRLGLAARPVDRQIAQALGVEVAGLLVDSVQPEGLAGAAGIMAGDIVLGLDGNPLSQPGDLAFALEAAADAGETVFTVLRGGQQMDLSATLDLAMEGDGGLLREVGPGVPAMVQSYTFAALGMTFDAEGRVATVTENSPAIYAGLAQGDLILTVNGVAVDLASYVLTDPALILVQAPGGQTRHVHLDPWTAQDGVRPVGGANVLDPDVVVF